MKEFLMWANVDEVNAVEPFQCPLGHPHSVSLFCAKTGTQSPKNGDAFC